MPSPKYFYTQGLIDGATYTRALHFLRTQDRDLSPAIALTLLDRPFYLDDLAVGFLQDAGSLQAVCRLGLTLFIHPSTHAEQSALIEAHREGDRLAETLDELRLLLRDAIESGKARFLPRHYVPGEETSIGWIHEVAPALAPFFRDASACDGVCIDDRHMNRHLTFTDEAGHTPPLLCVLDLLKYLEEQHVIGAAEKQEAFHKLRQAGYALVPVPPEELERYLLQARLGQNGQIIESAELRIIRQTLMRIRGLDMVELPTEAHFLEKLLLGCLIVIRHLWADEVMPVERVAVLSDWIWHHVAPSPLDWARNIVEPLRPENMPEAFAQHLAWLLKPMGMAFERCRAFSQWVEEEILEPLLPANADLERFSLEYTGVKE